MNDDWEFYDWHAILAKMPPDEWGHRPFVADDRVLYFLRRDNRPSYLFVADFESGPLGNQVQSQAKWDSVTDFNTLATFLVEKGYGKQAPAWLIGYVRRGFKKED